MKKLNEAGLPDKNDYVGNPAARKGPYSAREIPLRELTAKRIENFYKKVVRTAGCHVWTGATTGHPTHPYGSFRLGSGSNYPAHRIAWVIEHHSEIPKGLVIDHLCGITRCVNPSHLRLVTQRVNVEESSLERDPMNGHFMSPRSVSR